MISESLRLHEIDGTTVSKGTVINFFVSRAQAGEPLTVYEPGTQSRNYVHVKTSPPPTSAERAPARPTGGGRDRRRKVRGRQRRGPQRRDGSQSRGRHRCRGDGRAPEVKLVENPRADDETLTDTFEVDTSRARERLGWSAERNIESVVRDFSPKSERRPQRWDHRSPRDFEPGAAPVALRHGHLPPVGIRDLGDDREPVAGPVLGSRVAAFEHVRLEPSGIPGPSSATQIPGRSTVRPTRTVTASPTCSTASAGASATAGSPDGCRPAASS